MKATTITNIGLGEYFYLRNDENSTAYVRIESIKVGTGWVNAKVKTSGARLFVPYDKRIYRNIPTKG